MRIAQHLVDINTGNNEQDLLPDITRDITFVYIINSMEAFNNAELAHWERAAALFGLYSDFDQFCGNLGWNTHDTLYTWFPIMYQQISREISSPLCHCKLPPEAEAIIAKMRKRLLLQLQLVKGLYPTGPFKH